MRFKIKDIKKFFTRNKKNKSLNKDFSKIKKFKINLKEIKKINFYIEINGDNGDNDDKEKIGEMYGYAYLDNQEVKKYEIEEVKWFTEIDESKMYNLFYDAENLVKEYFFQNIDTKIVEG